VVPTHFRYSHVSNHTKEGSSRAKSWCPRKKEKPTEGGEKRRTLASRDGGKGTVDVTQKVRDQEAGKRGLTWTIGKFEAKGKEELASLSEQNKGD